MKVLLTGALGNIGLPTLEALLAEGHDVVAFDLESRRARKLASGVDGRGTLPLGRPLTLNGSAGALRNSG